jgi:hypothetical protein
LTVENGLEYPLSRLNNFHTCVLNMPTRKGRKNKRTLYREYRERVKQASAAINGEEHIGESLAVMAEAMEFFVQIARNTQEDLEERKASYRTAAHIGRLLAPFRYPTYATVKVGGDRETPLLVREGVTSKQVMAELLAKIKATGLLPTNLKNIIDATPQRMESQSG